MDQVRSFDSGRIRVGIAHEVRVLREGLAALLQQRPELAVIDITPPAEGEKLHKNDSLDDLVLLDVAGEDTAVADKIQGAKSRFRGAKVIVMGVSDSPSEILDCIEAGAFQVSLSPAGQWQSNRAFNFGRTSGQSTCGSSSLPERHVNFPHRREETIRRFGDRVSGFQGLCTHKREADDRKGTARPPRLPLVR